MGNVFRAIRQYLIIGCLFFATHALADEISSPPPMEDFLLEAQQYFDEIYDNWQIFPVTTTAPNGSRKGLIGRPVFYNNSGTFEFWVNTDGSTTWQRI